MVFAGREFVLIGNSFHKAIHELCCAELGATYRHANWGSCLGLSSPRTDHNAQLARQDIDTSVYKKRLETACHLSPVSLVLAIGCSCSDVMVGS